jgi:hypothetical protein
MMNKVQNKETNGAATPSKTFREEIWLMTGFAKENYWVIGIREPVSNSKPNLVAFENISVIVFQ